MGKIYFFYGEEKYDINNNVSNIKKEYEKLEASLNLFYITKDNVDTLRSACETVTFFGSDKLIIIKDTKLKFDVGVLEDLDDSTQIIILEDSVDKRTSEYKKISKMAVCKEFKHLSEREMTQYITGVLKKYNIQIASEVASYMVSVCALDKTNMLNELNKLVNYLDNGEDEKRLTITKDIIDLVCTKTLNAKIFDVLDLIINKEKKQAILQIDELVKQKEPIIKIYIMLYKQIKQMYQIAFLRENKEANIQQVLQINPYVFNGLSKASNKYTSKKLKEIIYEFDEYDKKTKQGDMDFNIGFKKIICNM